MDCATLSCVTSTSLTPTRLGACRAIDQAATHLIKVAVETALGRRPKMDVFGADYPTLGGASGTAKDAMEVLELPTFPDFSPTGKLEI